MEYILNIHTATEKAMVTICNGNKILSSLINQEPKQHAAFLHTAIKKILQKNDIQINSLKAVGVTAGPGSYTGIRVGLATAKGLCFSLKIPLLTFNTLEVMALSAIGKIGDPNALYCPMIDARRMEIFTAIYDHELNVIMPASAMVLEENTFQELAEKQGIYFFGNGSEKFKKFAEKIPLSAFVTEEISSEALSHFAWGKYVRKEFTDLVFAEPLYLKDFHSPIKL